MPKIVLGVFSCSLIEYPQSPVKVILSRVFPLKQLKVRLSSSVNIFHQLIVELELGLISVLFLNFVLYHVASEASMVAEKGIYGVSFKGAPPWNTEHHFQDKARSWHRI